MVRRRNKQALQCFKLEMCSRPVDFLAWTRSGHPTVCQRSPRTEHLLCSGHHPHPLSCYNPYLVPARDSTQSPIRAGIRFRAFLLPLVAKTKTAVAFGKSMSRAYSTDSLPYTNGCVSCFRALIRFRLLLLPFRSAREEGPQYSYTKYSRC